MGKLTGRVDEALYILFVVNAHAFTASHRLPLLKAVTNLGFKVEAVAPKGSPASQRLSSEGFIVHPISLSRRGLRVWEEWYSIRELVQLYRRLKPDLIHHATIKPVIYGSIAARSAGRPAIVNAITGLGSVYTSKNLKSRTLRICVDAMYRYALNYNPQRIIFQNRDDWTVLQKTGAVLTGQATLIPGSGVDVNHFVPTSEPDGRPIVALPARLIRDKGIDEFLAASRLLQDHQTNPRFVIIGGLDPGNPSAVTEGELQLWKREGTVEFWGQQDDMRDIYSKCNIVVLPSYREGLPKVLLEAGASGRPVVTTDVPGCRDVVVDGETGFIVPVRDPQALADRISKLLIDSKLRKSMGLAGRVRVEQNFSTERVITETLAIYDSLLKQGEYGNLSNSP